MMYDFILFLTAAAVGVLIGWFAKASSLEESTDYLHVSADCPDRYCCHPTLDHVCELCGYDPSYPEGERETI
jgi:hypothetical protein